MDTGMGGMDFGTVDAVAGQVAGNLAVSEATIADLGYLRAQLAAAEVPFLLVRDRDHRLVLAADAAHRAMVRRVTAAAGPAGVVGDPGPPPPGGPARGAGRRVARLPVR
ncbi:hypothetical protein [Nocardia farcinica]|uniref:hypothetical protein n=1 Tax=Nocardia farcinica TaxID=37329 RepID=UPI00245638B0|nr:hypothetical protein [Nocardia farcinica]